MAGRTDLERLVISMEAKLSTFEKQMARAYPIADKAARQVENRFKKAESVLANFGRGFSPANLLAGLTVGTFTAAVKQTINTLSDIKDSAERAGISIKEFQQLAFVARQGGGSSNDIVDLFQALNVKLGDAKVKGNDLTEILKANNVPLVDANGQMRSNIELFEDIVDLINRASSEQERGIILRAAFNKSAADSLPFLRQTVAELRAGKKEAHDLGIEIDTELVKRAEEMGDKWEKIWEKWSSHGLIAVATVAAAIDDRISNGAGIVRGVTRDTFMKPEFVGPEINRLAKQRKEAQEHLANVGKDFFPNISAPELEAQIAELSRRIAELSQVFLHDLSRNPYETMRGAPRPATVIPPLGGGKGKAAKAETLLDLIAAVESGGGYNTTLGHGKYLAGGERELTTKTLDEIDAIQSEILRNPANKTGASPAGRYQIVQRTLRSLRKELDLSGNELFTPELQDKLATTLINRRGRNPDALRNEFEGLRSRPNDQILNLYDSMSKDRIGAREDVVKVQVDKEKETEEQIANLHKEADEARKEQQEELLKYQTDHLERVADENQKAADASAQAWDEAGATIAGVAQGFVQDLMNGVSAADALKNAVARLADAAISNFFSMVFQGGAGGGGLFGGLVRAAAPGAGAALGALGNAGNAGAVPLGAPSAITSVARAGNAAPINVRVSPSQYFDVVVDSRANTLDAVRQAGTLSTARRHAPRTMNRFQQLGTV